MPTWQPDWSDVPFDHAAAREYASACRQTSATLRHTADQRTHLASEAAVDWEGPKRDRFDRDITTWNSEAAALADQLASVAKRVEDASDTARRLQAQREGDRARWWAEIQAEKVAADELRANEAAAAQRAALESRLLTGESD